MTGRFLRWMFYHCALAQCHMKIPRPLGRGGFIWVQRIVFAILIFVGIIPCPILPTSCSSVAAEELKIGYVNLAKTFDQYQRTKASDAVLEQKGHQKEAELQAKVKELQKLREGLELLSDDVRDTKARELEEKAEELQRFRTRTARDLSRERDQIAQQILKEIQQAVEDYAKANGFSFILDDRATLYALPASDVTVQLIDYLNQRTGQKKAR